MDAWLLLQLADSAFPTGGFAHSGGLEAVVQLGELGGSGEDGIASFTEQILWQTGLASLPFLGAGHAGVPDLVSLDTLTNAFLSNHVANRASRVQGRAFVSTCSRVFDESAVADLDAAVRSRRIRGHYAPIFGAALAAMGATRKEAAQLFLHQSLRGVISAAVRLGVTGPHEAQRIQHRLAPVVSDVAESCRDLPLESAAQPAPHLDLLGALHDRLYARLFQS